MNHAEVNTHHNKPSISLIKSAEAKSEGERNGESINMGPDATMNKLESSRIK